MSCSIAAMNGSLQGGPAVELSVVIVSYNTRELLRGCLRSLLAGTAAFQRVQVIVVDNASADGSAEMVRQEFAEVELVCNAENRMFSKANNQGIAAARGECVVLLNSDTIVHSGCFEILVRFLADHPQVAAVGPRVLNADGTFQSCGFIRPSIKAAAIGSFGLHRLPLPTRVRKWMGAERDDAASPPRRVAWIAGCCMVVSRDVLRRVGGLCEDLIFYGEEPEWCWRAEQAGYELWCVPGVSITHLGGGSTKGEICRHLSQDSVRLRNYAVLQSKTVGRKKAIAMALVVIAGNCFRCAVACVIRPKAARIFREHIEWEITVLRYLLSSFPGRNGPSDANARVEGSDLQEVH